MVKVKKKEALSLGEKLEQALIPIDEQPYKVPENWCWVKLGEVVHLNRGSSPRPIKSYLTNADDGVNWIKIGDTDAGKYINETKEKITREGAKKSVPVKAGDLLLTNSMSYGKPFILNIDGCIHDGWFAIETGECFDKDFLYYSFLASQWYFDKIAVGTAVRNISSDRTFTTPLVMPPIAEQQRIVKQIEGLYVRLDEAKEKLQDIIDTTTCNKKRILQDGFEGKLTRRWREDNGVSIDSWEYKTLQDVCSQMKAGGDKPDDFVSEQDEEHKIPVVANGIAHDGIVGYTTEEKYDAGAVTVSGRGTIGFSVSRKYPFYPIVRLIVLCPKKDIINSQFLKYVFDAYPEEGTGSSIPQLTVPAIRDKRIPLPSIEEQEQIVCIIEGLFDSMDTAVRIAEENIDKIELIKKAILAKAFRGELGTNNPEESATELLKSILS